MLKKLDLSKQFELVVKQEIKNYNDSLEFILGSIRELKESNESIKKDSLKVFDSLRTSIEELRAEINAVREGVNYKFQNARSSINDQSALNLRSHTKIIELSNEFQKRNTSEETIQTKLENLWNEIYQLKSKTEINAKSFKDSLDCLLLRFHSEIEAAKNEILSAPTDAQKVKTEIEEKLDCHKVDVAGIMRELNIYKRDNLVTQKKIENIYTLIDRLKKAEVKA